MKLIGNLKNEVAKANSKEEARTIISKAGMELTMDELDIVVGGTRMPYSDIYAGMKSGNDDTDPFSPVARIHSDL
jgi:hypothetical protein